jgi:hypothetical protein
MSIKPVEICTQNALDKYSTLLISSGEVDRNNLFDNDSSTLWQSEIASDEQTETITVEFRDLNQNDITQDIDRLILQNTNIKYLTAQAVSLDQSVYDIITTQAQDMQGRDVIIDFTPLAPGQFAHKIILFLHTTQTPDEKKQIGELKFCKKITTLSDALVNLARNDETDSGHFRTTDGRLFCWRDWNKFAAELSLSNVNTEKKSTIEQIYEQNDFITLIHFNDENTKTIEAEECRVIHPPNFLHERATNLYETVLVLKGR